MTSAINPLAVNYPVFERDQAESVPKAASTLVSLGVKRSRRCALEHLRSRLAAEPNLIRAFWGELANSQQVEAPELTALYSYLELDGETFLAIEFVAGESLEQLVKRSDPDDCEKAIPLFCLVLDSFDNGSSAASKTTEPSGDDLRCLHFGLARIARVIQSKIHGAVVFGPNGRLLAESLFGDGDGRAEIEPLLTAFYQKLMGEMPGDAPESADEVIVAPLSMIPTARSAAAPAVERPVVEGRKQARRRRRMPTAFIGAGSAILVLAAFFGSAGLLAKHSVRDAFFSLFSAATPAPESAKSQPPARAAEASVVPAEPAKKSAALTRTANRAARLLSSPPLQYPPAARAQGITGIVRLEVVVTPDGGVRNPRVVSGHPLLGQEAAEAVKTWHYQPALLNGKPVSSSAEIEIEFNLDAQAR